MVNEHTTTTIITGQSYGGTAQDVTPSSGSRRSAATRPITPFASPPQSSTSSTTLITPPHSHIWSNPTALFYPDIPSSPVFTHTASASHDLNTPSSSTSNTHPGTCPSPTPVPLHIPSSDVSHLYACHPHLCQPNEHGACDVHLERTNEAVIQHQRHLQQLKFEASQGAPARYSTAQLTDSFGGNHTYRGTHVTSAVGLQQHTPLQAIPQTATVGSTSTTSLASTQALQPQAGIHTPAQTLNAVNGEVMGLQDAVMALVRRAKPAKTPALPKATSRRSALRPPQPFTALNSSQHSRRSAKASSRLQIDVVQAGSCSPPAISPSTRSTIQAANQRDAAIESQKRSFVQEYQRVVRHQSTSPPITPSSNSPPVTQPLTDQQILQLLISQLQQPVPALLPTSSAQIHSAPPPSSADQSYAVQRPKSADVSQRLTQVPVMDANTIAEPNLSQLNTIKETLITLGQHLQPDDLQRESVLEGLQAMLATISAMLHTQLQDTGK